MSYARIPKYIAFKPSTFSTAPAITFDQIMSFQYPANWSSFRDSRIFSGRRHNCPEIEGCVDIADRLRLDVPVGQAGMGGGLAGGPLAAAVAKAGGMGTLGLARPGQLRAAIHHVRAEAPGRAVAVNLLMHFAHRGHIAACVDEHVDVVVVAFGGDRGIVEHLHDAGIFVFVMVGTEAQARQAIGWGADGLIAQGREAGGHLVGTMAALDFLPHARAAAGPRPVFVAGGIATGTDTRRALDAGADGVIAGTRFLMTHEADAHPEYQRRILGAESTMETTLFGFSWPLRHRVIPNAATLRWCRSDGTARALPAALNTGSRWLAAVGYLDAGALIRLQSPRLPIFTPLAPLNGMPDSSVDTGALYAGDTALRISEVISAQQAVNDLAP